MSVAGREGIRADGRPYRVLVVDDDQAEGTQLVRYLESLGFEVPDLIPDGRKLLTFLRNSDQPVDLVLLDIIMPVLDGFAAFWEMKTLQGPPPVIFVSVENSVAVAKYLLENGAADYVTRPYNRGKLLERMLKVLGRPAKP